MALSRTEIKEKLIEIMNYAVGDTEVDLNDLDESADLVSDIGLNSVGVLYIVVAIEEVFNIEFENVGFSDFKSIGEVIDYIQEKMDL